MNYCALLLSLLFSCQLPAVEAQFSTHFQRRFGIDSSIYNSPLYFSSPRKTKKPSVKKQKYRTQVKKTLQKNERRKRAATPTKNTQGGL